MDLQYLIVLGSIAAASVYSGLVLFRRLRRFTSSGGGCGAACGCSTETTNDN